jgi:serine/threonine protein phosphatase 1
MLSRLLKRKPVVVAPRTPAVPEGVIVWAVGDIHGRLDLLEPLVRGIVADADASVADRKIVIFLGDYVDRGPDSRGVISFLADLPRDGDIEWRFLKGNHEETMLDFLTDPAIGPQWCEYGGEATFASYGLKLPDLRHKPEAWAHLAADLDHRLTAGERRFLEALELNVTVGDYFFVHAGARPGVTLDQQTAHDMMWIRRTFLDSDVVFDRVVVHGHTPTAEVHADHRRLGIDTKAYASGRLTALRLEGRRADYLQTEISDGGGVVVQSIANTPRPLTHSAA